jgi:hypothetical protein
MSSLPYSFYYGDAFDSNVCPVIPQNEDHLPALWAFAEAGEYRSEIRKIDQKIAVANATMVKVPFDLDHWTKVAGEKYPNGLPKPYSDDPTQCIFHGHPAKVATASSRCDNQSQDGSATLQVAVARLLGYRWPAELESRSGFQPLDKKNRARKALLPWNFPTKPVPG